MWKLEIRNINVVNEAHPSIGDPSFRGLIGIARRDITPPVGIYARNWAAATHDVATAIHRPLTLTCITFQTSPDAPPLVLIAADLMSWRSREDEWFVRGGVLEALSLDESRLMFCLSHTHAAPGLRREDEGKPGGELIAPYRTMVRDAAIDAAREAIARRQAVTLAWRYGRCDLATNRDFPEPGGSRVLCGFNPDMPADDTLLVGRISSDSGRVIGTIVNYACHPTTLAWLNSKISPDYVGAMREIVEAQTQAAPCLFLQGASGDLAPAEQYIGDTTVADRHGARLGYAVLSTIAAMRGNGRRLAFDEVVESGAPLAVWRERDAPPVSGAVGATMRTIELPLKQMPSVAELETQMRGCEDPVIKERLARKRAIRKVVGEGRTSPQRLWAWRLGDSFLVGQPSETYSIFQQHLRAKFPNRAVAVMNLVNGSAGYLPPREMHAKDVYQVTQTPFAEGSLELLIDAAERALSSLT